jgi:hypothetical protein
MRVLVAFAMSVVCALPLFSGEQLDRIVATVGHHAILRSDVEEEARFSELLAGKSGEITTEDKLAALDRLVDRALIDDQISALGGVPVSEEAIKARVQEIRSQIPGADTAAGWQRLLERHGFTEGVVEQHVSQEVQTLRFVDMRFRSEVRVGPKGIQTYYDSVFVPEMKKKNVAPPPLADVQDQIEQILREQRENNLIADWLKSLRTQARIQTFDPALPLAGLAKKTPDISDLRFLPLRTTRETQAAKP